MLAIVKILAVIFNKLWTRLGYLVLVVGRL